MLRYVAAYTMLPELISAVGRCYLAVPAVYVLRWPLASGSTRDLFLGLAVQFG